MYFQGKGANLFEDGIEVGVGLGGSSVPGSLDVGNCKIDILVP